MRFSLFIIASFVALISNSQTISIDDAKIVGENFYLEKENRNNNLKLKDIKVTSIELVNSNDVPVYYLLSTNDNGFVIVSANKNVVPILAYSNESKFEGIIPPAVTFWLNRYKEQIEYIVVNGVKNIENQNKWNRLLNIGENNTKEVNDVYVAPLVQSKWDQGKYYNASCPEDVAGPDGHTLTGCVATATAQLLYYHRFPNSGTGSYTYNCPGYGTISENFSLASYDYEAMPYKLTDYSDNASLLLYHLGVTFDMEYGPSGSAVWNHSVDNSLKTYFKYCPETQYLFRDSTTLNWDSIVVSNLLDNKPLYYAGWDDLTFQSGHAFVCDGYDGPDYYHFNWGWGGSYDGWFYSNNITPGGSQFTYAQEIIKDIYPDTNLYSYPLQCAGVTSLSYSSGSITDGSGNNNYETNAGCTWLINPICGKMIDTYIDDFNLEDNDTLFIYDGNETENILIEYYVKGDEPKLSWMTNPDILTAYSGELMVKFKSDTNVEGRGWKLSYFADYCKFGYNLTDTIGTISDGSKVCNYEPGTSCKWTIEPAGAEAIRINFTEFELDPNQTYDNVRIFKDTPGTANEIAKFTINNLPSEVIVPSGIAVITFSTSPNSSGEGWSLNYEKIVLSNIEDEIENVISIYPNPTTGIVNIKNNKIIGDVFITDISGRIIFEDKIQADNLKVNLFGMEKGMYFMKIDNFIYKIVLE